MARDLKEFALVKAIQATAYSLEDNSVIADTKNVKTFSLTDETGIDYIKGGEMLNRLIPVMGEQNVTLEFSTATTSFDWLKLQINSDVIDGATIFDTNEEFTLDSNVKITIDGLKGVSTIYLCDAEADGRDGKVLKQVTLKPQHYAIGTTLTVVADGTMTDPTTEVEEATVKVDIPTIQIGDTVDLIPAEVLADGQYTVDLATGEITFFSNMEDETVHVFFSKEIAESKTIRSAGGQAPSVKLIIKGVFTDPATQRQFVGNIICYKAKMEQKNNLSAKNDGVPDDITMTFGGLYSKANKCTYEIVSVGRDLTAE